jgi:hypothetical protein
MNQNRTDTTPPADIVDQVITLAITTGQAIALTEAGDTELIRRLVVTGWSETDARTFIRAFSHRLQVACFGPGYNS